MSGAATGTGHIALFDFDRTLVDVNSAHLWLRHEIRAGRVSRTQAAWAAYWFVRYHLGMSGGLAAAFHEAASAYRGIADEALRAWTASFFDARIRPRLRPGAARALERHRQAGDRVVLASSTTQYLAEQVCATWGLEPGVHSELEVVDGRLTGGVARMALGPHKADRLREWASSRVSRCRR